MSAYRPRREFLKLAAAGVAALLARPPLQAGSPIPNLMGMFTFLDPTPKEALGKVTSLGLTACEIYTETFSDPAAQILRQALEAHPLTITALFTMGPGPLAWDFRKGPSNNGVVPRRHRAERVARLKQASDFAKDFSIPAIETEIGFVPENPGDALYAETVETLQDVVGHCKRNDQTFLYHAGAETPVTMLRLLEDVGLDNQGVGLDTANPILYGTGRPEDALEVYGHWVKAVNAKDGHWPVNPWELGKETAIGKGSVDFPAVIRRLKRLNYAGPIIIEREISGPQQLEDVSTSKVYLESLLSD